MTEPWLEQYQDEGAFLFKGVLSDEDLSGVRLRLLEEIRKFFACADEQDPEWVRYSCDHPDDVTRIYDAVANIEEAVALGSRDPVKAIVRQVLGPDAKLYGKIPFRIDIPGETKELAVWHQDDFYVKGAPNELVVWIPLQDTPVHLGALGVIKGSHKAGKIPHDVKWGKKMMPQNCFSNPVTLAEMEKGDLLIFNSYTLHTSNMNLSDKIRYSLQLRFTSQTLGTPSNVMGGLHDI